MWEKTILKLLISLDEVFVNQMTLSALQHTVEIEDVASIVTRGNFCFRA